MASKIYRKLNPILRETRVLKLEPSSDPSSQICCELRKEFVADSRPYQALSYVWGDSIERATISVNGEPFLVTMNLFTALNHLRHPSSNVYLWIDAICIDQSNTTERNNQLELMKDIYSLADRVLIWLGDSEDESDLAMDLVQKWARPGAEAINLSQLLETLENPFDVEAWRAARRLFARPYWTRVWIFQEIVFSKEATVICGTKQVSWQDFGNAQIAWVQLSQPENSHLCTSDQLRRLNTTNYNVASPISLQHLVRKNNMHPGSAINLIRLTSNLNATDPRDKIYALQGFDEILVLGLDLDYNKPVETVYGEFVAAYLEEELNLDILCLAGNGFPKVELLEGLPTWIPDFRGFIAHQRPPTLGNFSTADRKAAEALISDDFKILTAKGIVFDKITKIDVGRTEDRKAIKTRWLELALSDRESHPTGVPRLQAFFRTMIADKSGHGYGLPTFKDAESEKTFFDYAAGMMWWMGDGRTGRRDMPSQPSREQQLKEQQLREQADFEKSVAILEESDYVQRFLSWSGDIPNPLTRQTALAPFLGDPANESLHHLIWPNEHDANRGSQCRWAFAQRQAHTATSRSFFLTEKGYMGIAPRGAKLNDRICIVLGCDKPLIVRGISEYFNLVGDSYIYGMMNGEVLEEVRNERATFTNIIFK
jgi:hypothetical protein